MSISPEKKKTLITDYARFEGDTGSPEVQVALLSERIANLTEHLKLNKKDFNCRRSLLVLVARRRSLLQYLQKLSQDRYLELIKRLGLRK